MFGRPRFICDPILYTDLGRCPTGSGARTVVARLPLAPASGRRRGPPRRASRHPPYHEALPPCAHSLFEPLVESPTRRPKSSQWDFPVGFEKLPLGSRSLPSGKSETSQWEGAGSHWEVTRAVAASAAASKEAPIRPPPSLFAVTQFSRLRCRRVAGLTLRGCSRLS